MLTKLQIYKHSPGFSLVRGGGGEVEGGGFYFYFLAPITSVHYVAQNCKLILQFSSSFWLFCLKYLPPLEPRWEALFIVWYICNCKFDSYFLACLIFVWHVVIAHHDEYGFQHAVDTFVAYYLRLVLMTQYCHSQTFNYSSLKINLHIFISIDFGFGRFQFYLFLCSWF